MSFASLQHKGNRIWFWTLFPSRSFLNLNLWADYLLPAPPDHSLHCVLQRLHRLLALWLPAGFSKQKAPGRDGRKIRSGSLFPWFLPSWVTWIGCISLFKVALSTELLSVSPCPSAGLGWWQVLPLGNPIILSILVHFPHPICSDTNSTF